LKKEAQFNDDTDAEQMQRIPREFLTCSYLVQDLEKTIKGGLAAPCDFHQPAWWFQQHIQTAPSLMLKA